MTNAEKFKEVFGFELNTSAFKHSFCIAKDFETCKKHEGCETCPYYNWEESEFQKMMRKTIVQTYYKDNIKAILECYFTGFKEEIIDSACNRILDEVKGVV